MLYSYKATIHVPDDENHKISGMIEVSRHHWMPEQRIKDYLIREHALSEDYLGDFEVKEVPQI